MKKRINLKNDAMVKRDVLLEQERSEYHTPVYYKNEIITEGKWTWLDNLWKSSPTIKSLGKKTMSLFDTAILSKNAEDWKVVWGHINTSKEEILKIADDYLIKNPKLKQQHNITANMVVKFYEQWLGKIFNSLRTGTSWDEFLTTKNINPDVFAEDRLVSFIDTFMGGSPSVKKSLKLTKGKILKPRLSKEILEIMSNGMGKNIKKVATSTVDKILADGKKLDISENKIFVHPDGKMDREGAIGYLMKLIGVSRGNAKAGVKLISTTLTIIRIKYAILNAFYFILGLSASNFAIMALTKDPDFWRARDVLPGAILGWIPGLYHLGDLVENTFKSIGGMFAQIGKNEIREISKNYIHPIFEGMEIDQVRNYDCNQFKKDFGQRQSYGKFGILQKFLITILPGDEEDVNKIIQETDWNPLCVDIKKNYVAERMVRLRKKGGLVTTEDISIDSLNQSIGIIERNNNFDIPENLCSMFGAWYTDPNDGHAWSIDNDGEVNSAKESFCSYKEDREGCYTAFIAKINSCKTNE